MTDLISAIHDDIKRYLALCEKYGEQPELDERGVPECYGSHSDSLEKRNKVDYE